jgi:glutamate decarboxylase
MVQAQAYNFLRLGRSGYTEVVEAMMANARYLNEQLEGSGKFEILNPGLAEPVVTFKIKGDPGFDVYQLSDRLREDGWIVPAYNLPPDAEDVHLMRVVVRIDLSRRLIDMLLLDLLQAWEQLSEERPPKRKAPRPDLWTHPTKAAGHSKRRSVRRTATSKGRPPPQGGD